MGTIQENAETELKEEFILLIAYYIMVLVAMLCTILCTCHKKNNESIFCCQSSKNGFFDTELAQRRGNDYPKSIFMVTKEHGQNNGLKTGPKSSHANSAQPNRNGNDAYKSCGGTKLTVIGEA